MVTESKSNSSLWGLRTILLVGVLSFVARKNLQSFFFPHGFAVRIPASERVSYAPIDRNNDLLQAKHGKLTKIIERVEEGQEPLLKGPETVTVSPSGDIYGFSRGARLVRLDDFQPTNDPTVKTARATLAADLGHGAALSGRFTPDGETLYVADPLLGLARIRNFQDPRSKLEIVASNVMDNGVLTPLYYVDDVVVGPKTGKVYFSDASDVPPDRLVQKGDWDVLYASKVECIRGRPSGRLLQYDPETDEVTVLARGLYFANGVTVDKDETYLIQSQTFSMRLSKYHLTGPKQGTLETVVGSDQFTGYLDGTDCSWAESGPSAGKCYAAVPMPILTLLKALQVIPHPIDQFLRGFLLTLPRSLAPEPKDYGCVVEIDMTTGAVRTLQDPDATDMKFITGVRVHDNKLYLGSLRTDVVGIYDLN